MAWYEYERDAIPVGPGTAGHVHYRSSCKRLACATHYVGGWAPPPSACVCVCGSRPK